MVLVDYTATEFTAAMERELSIIGHCAFCPGSGGVVFPREIGGEIEAE